MAQPASRPISRAPRLLKRYEAAAYLSVSENKFDEMVRDGRMPPPKLIDRRKAWDVYELDARIDNLPSDGDSDTDTTWDD